MCYNAGVLAANWSDVQVMQFAPERPFPRGWALFMLGLCLFGIGLRGWALGELPIGLYQDEAYNGLDALTGEYRWYYPANNGREPLFLWLVTVSVQTLGPSALAVRLPAAVMGVLLIGVMGWLAAQLYGQRVGWLAAVVTALTFWPLALSRVSFRAGSLPLLLTLTLVLAVLAARKRHSGLAGLAGLALGLSAYTYSAARIVPLVLLAWVGILVWQQRKTLRAWWLGLPRRQLLVGGVCASLMLVPLLVTALNDPQSVFGRLGQVGVSDPQQVLTQLGRTLLMFNVSGDTIGRHNLPGRPVFDVLMGLAFLLGLWQVGRKAQRGEALAGLLLLWWLGLLLPTALADDAPHFLRSVGVLPPTLLMAALGLNRLWQSLPPRWAGGVVAGVLLLSAMLTSYDYFGRYANNPETGVWFQVAARQLADEGQTADAPLWIDARLWQSFASVRYLLARQPDLIVYDQHPPPNWPPTHAATMVVWPYEDFSPSLAAVPARMMLTRYEGAAYREDRQPPELAYPLYTRFALEPAPSGLALAQSENGVELLAASYAVLDDRVRVRLVLRVNAPQAIDWHIFVHVLAADGSPLAQADGPPLAGDWQFTRWQTGQAGQHMVELYFNPMPDDITVLAGLFDPGTGERLQFALLSGIATEIWTVDQTP